MGRIGGVRSIANLDQAGLSTDAEAQTKVDAHAAVAAAHHVIPPNPAYAQVTANQGSITAEADLTGLSVAITVAANRRVRITGQALLRNSSASTIADLSIYEDSTRLSYGAIQCGLANVEAIVQVRAVVTPGAGAHTYKLRAGRGAGVGTVTMIAAADRPAFILVEDIGPA